MSGVLQRYKRGYNNESLDSKGSSNTAMRFKESIDSMVDVMKLQIGEKYHRFVSHLRKRCLNCIRRGQKSLVHLYYSYPVSSDGYRSVLKLHKFLKRDVGLNIRELTYQGHIVGFRLQLKQIHGA